MSGSLDTTEEYSSEVTNETCETENVTGEMESDTEYSESSETVDEKPILRRMGVMFWTLLGYKC